jgi:hypothetical protein
VERVERLESKADQDRGAARSAPRSAPLTLVTAAVAGDDLLDVACSAARGLGRPVVIAIPALGEPAVWPSHEVAPPALREIVLIAAAVARGEPVERLLDGAGAVAGAVPVRIGEDAVGVVAAVAAPGAALDTGERAWLEAGAAAAAVVAVVRDAREGGVAESARALVSGLLATPPADVGALVEHARRLGFDLAEGGQAMFGIARAPRHEADISAPSVPVVPVVPGVLLAELERGRVAGVIPARSRSGVVDDPAAAAARLASAGLVVAVSAPRHDPVALHEALREAELLAELAAAPDAELAGQEETFRLLIGVLLRDPAELERLRAQTVAPLLAYDATHETELVATLQAFLAHDCSTSDTAEALALHRHTVGYRLARVQEVSGLSPYESDGRERLGLGLKAHHILRAAGRLG